MLGLCMFLSCSDGNLQIEAVDFDGGSIQFCDEGQEDTETTLFFKINGDEVLILALQANLIGNRPSTNPITTNIGSGSSLTYRLLSDAVDQSYICGDVPPVSPTVVEEIPATGGTVQITTSLDTASRTSKIYNHEFLIPEVTLVNSLGESLTDQTGIEFGDYKTIQQSSVELVFSNFVDTTIDSCEITGETIELTKVLDDEFISLTVPLSLIANVETDDTPRQAFLNANTMFKNGIAKKIVTTDDVCNGISSAELENEFSTTEGTVSVVTVVSGPDSEGVITYTHTISLMDFVLQDINGASLSAIDSYVFGNYVTTAN